MYLDLLCLIVFSMVIYKCLLYLPAEIFSLVYVIGIPFGACCLWTSAMRGINNDDNDNKHNNKRSSKNNFVKDILNYNNEMFINEEEILCFLRKHPKLFRHIRFPTCKMIKVAVSRYGYNIAHVDEEFCSKYLYSLAIKSNGNAIKYIPKKYRHDYLKKAVLNNGRVLRYIDDQTEEMCLSVIKPRSCMKFIRVFTDAVKNKMVETDGMYLKYINKTHQTRELCEKAVEQNPLAVKYAFYKNEIVVDVVTDVVTDDKLLMNVNTNVFDKYFSKIIPKYFDKSNGSDDTGDYFNR